MMIPLFDGVENILGKEEKRNDGPGVPHLSSPHCDSKIWPKNLVLDPTWSVFILIQEIVRANILTKFNGYLN